jgi:hypothetical protein
LQITDLVWAANDWKLYTCDGDGGLCRFNLYTDQHITDMVFRGQSICGLAVSDNLKEIYTVAQDSSVREIYGRMVRVCAGHQGALSMIEHHKNIAR